MHSRVAWAALALFASLTVLADEVVEERPDLSRYSHFELRPVKALTTLTTDEYEKFSYQLQKNLEQYTARWAEADRKQKDGERVIFEVSLLDDKINEQKHIWKRPAQAGARVAAQVEAIDARTGAVIGRATFKEASGATTTPGAMGSSRNRMVTALAWRSSNYIINLTSSQLSASPAN